MAFIWTPDLAVGVKEIDDQHKALFKAVDDLLEAMQRREGGKELERIVKFLGDYTKQHFSMEENLMTRSHYPDIVNHKAQHQGFIKAFTSIAVRLNTEGPSLTLVMEAQKTVCDWLRGHVSVTDRKLGGFLQEHDKAA